MSKTRIVVDEILRSLSRLNGQAQDAVIHSTSDFRETELVRYTIDQIHVEIEHLKVKLDKIRGNKVVVDEATPVPEPTPASVPPAPTPTLAPVPAPVPSSTSSTSTTAEPARRSRIKINIPERVEKENIVVSFPITRRR
jgi:hypothetical protein